MASDLASPTVLVDVQDEAAATAAATDGSAAIAPQQSPSVAGAEGDLKTKEEFRNYADSKRQEKVRRQTRAEQKKVSSTGQALCSSALPSPVLLLPP